jgi:transcriptional regulator with XRE-family HTH domain
MYQKTVSLDHIQRVTETLRLLRRKMEYSQEYMAFMLNISQNAYSRLENGKTPLTVNRLFEICTLLKISPGELLAADPDTFV